MTHGIRIVVDGELFNLASDDRAAALVDVIPLGRNEGSGSRSYPRLVGCTLYHIRIWNSGVSSGPDDFMHAISFSQDGDIPVIEWEQRSDPSKASYIYVFAEGRLSPEEGERGFIIEGEDGNIVVSDRTYNMAYKGKASFVSSDTGMPNYVQQTWDISRGSWEYIFTMSNVGSEDQPPLPFVKTSDTGSNKWASVWGMEYLGGNDWRFVVLQHATDSGPNNPGETPEVFVFNLYEQNNNGDYGIVIWDEEGVVCLNTEERPLVIEGITSIRPEDRYGQTNTSSINVPNNAAFTFAGNLVVRETLTEDQFNYNAFYSAGCRIRSNDCEVLVMGFTGGSLGTEYVRNRDHETVITIDTGRYE